MPYLIAIIVILLLRPWWRPIAAWGLLIFALWSLYRLAPLIGVAQGWLSSVVSGVLIGIVLGLIVLFVPMYNLMIEMRRRAAHDRVDKEHDGLKY